VAYFPYHHHYVMGKSSDLVRKSSVISGFHRTFSELFGIRRTFSGDVHKRSCGLWTIFDNIISSGKILYMELQGQQEDPDFNNFFYVPKITVSHRVQQPRRSFLEIVSLTSTSQDHVTIKAIHLFFASEPRPKCN